MIARPGSCLRTLTCLVALFLLSGCGLSEYGEKMSKEQQRLEKLDKQTKASNKSSPKQ